VRRSRSSLRKRKNTWQEWDSQRSDIGRAKEDHVKKWKRRELVIRKKQSKGPVHHIEDNPQTAHLLRGKPALG